MPRPSHLWRRYAATASSSIDHAIPDVGDPRRVDGADLLELEVADILQQPLAVAEQDRDDVELELIDEPRGEVLLHDVGPSPDQHVVSAGRLPRLFYR